MKERWRVTFDDGMSGVVTMSEADLADLMRRKPRPQFRAERVYRFPRLRRAVARFFVALAKRCDPAARVKCNG